MSIAIYSGPALGYAHGEGITRPVVITQFGGGAEQRSTRSGRSYRTYPGGWVGLEASERDAVDAFFVARGGMAESFLWRNDDPTCADPFHREAVSFGPSVDTVLIYSLPTGASEYAGDYPLTAPLVVTKDGTVVTATTATEARTVTLAGNPGAAHVLAASYLFYRRVRLDGPLNWTRGEHGLWGAPATFREVPS